MVSLTESEIELVDPIVRSQAKRVAARYEGVDPEDLAQEVWLTLLGSPGPAMYDYIQRGAIGLATKSIYNAAVKWCEKDKKRRLREAGIDWRDEYNYSRSEVARLLPMALDIGAVPGFTGRVLDDAPSAQSDPAHGGDLLVSLLDVRHAYSKLSGEDQRYISVCLGLDCNWDQIAATTELLASSAYAKWMRILDRMVTRHLGRKTDADE